MLLTYLLGTVLRVVITFPFLLKKGGKLYSVDIDDCSKISKNKKWKFIQSRDDNFSFIGKNIPKKVDVIFLDSLHEVNHVTKMINHYYKILNKNGFFFVFEVCC